MFFPWLNYESSRSTIIPKNIFFIVIFFTTIHFSTVIHYLVVHDPEPALYILINTQKISNVIWTKCRLKCNLETMIFKHVYHIKITLQDHTSLQKISGIRKYPVSGNIRYLEISGIIWYSVSGHIRYPEISGMRE